MKRTCVFDHVLFLRHCSVVSPLKAGNSRAYSIINVQNFSYIIYKNRPSCETGLNDINKNSTFCLLPVTESLFLTTQKNLKELRLWKYLIDFYHP
jgi:hypothetical protein